VLNTLNPVSFLTALYVLTLDSLTLSLEINPQADLFNLAFIKTNYPLIGKNYRVAQGLTLQPVPRPKGTQTFRHRFIVYADGQEIGTLSTDPKGVCAELSGLVSFTFANPVFYTGAGWYQHHKTLCRVLKLHVRCITYCEIALDSNASRLKPLDDIFHDCTLAKRRGTTPRYKAVLPRLTAQPDGYGGYRFGKPARGPRGNGKQVVAYDKTEEIQKNGKQYITDWHEANGLDPTAVERWEVRYANKWLHSFNVTVEDLDNPTKLVEIYAHGMRDVVTFNDTHQPYHDTHRNLKFARLSLLDVDKITPQRLKKIERGVQEDPRKLKERGALKVAVCNWIETRSPGTADYIREFIQQSPPRGKTWPELIEQYANSYLGVPHDGVVLGLNNVAQLYQQMPAAA
jgi:hypothetical protein